jgi:pimeloyl-ACP methyl ester carboxylesterase
MISKTSFLILFFSPLICFAQNNGLGMTNPVDAPVEPCDVMISDLNSRTGKLLLPDVYQLPPAPFLLWTRDEATGETPSDFSADTSSTQHGSLIPYLRYEARIASGFQPNVSPHQVLVDAVKVYLGLMPTNPPLDAQSLAKAIAQLSVTGRRAFDAFVSWHPQAGAYSGPQDSDLVQLVQQQYPAVDVTSLKTAVGSVLDDAYSALWAISSNDPGWRAKRLQMGWIAVSGEDDTPHRPVNVYTAPYPQYDLPVWVPLSNTAAITARTRFMVASAETFIGPGSPPAGLTATWPTTATIPLAVSPGAVLSHPTQNVIGTNVSGITNPLTSQRAIPVDKLPTIPANAQFIIYIHGGGSRLEEAVPLANELISQGYLMGQHYVVISLDLPNSAYGDSFDPASVYGSTYVPLPTYPILTFERTYVVNFIESLDSALGDVKNRIVAIMGGSLGGNLSLMLGGLYDGSHPYLRTLVAWSPTAMLKTDGVSKLVVTSSWLGQLDSTHWGPENGGTTRINYFNNLYFQPLSTLLGLPPDPQMWFRDDDSWTNQDARVKCKPSEITQSRFDRYEIYSPQIRRWTTAVDLEQATYDFRDPEPDGRPHYLAISSRILLVAGEKDNYSHNYNPGGAAATGVLGMSAGALAGTAIGGPIGAGIFGPGGAIVGGVYGAGIPTLNNVDIYGYTHDVANLMANTNGRTLFIKNTGHSIHAERPRFFAHEIIDFLMQPDTNLRIDLNTGDDDLRWNSQGWAVFFNKSNQAILVLPLNEMCHPWNSNPPAIDNPCGFFCTQLQHFEFPANSTLSFTVGLSRTGIKVGDIGAFGIQFVGGSSKRTDTGDNWNLNGVVLGAVSGPAGTGTMVSAWGLPLKHFTSPNSVWQTSEITAPVPRLPVLTVRAQSGVDSQGNWTIVTALYPDGTAVKGNVDVFSAVAKWVGLWTSTKTGASRNAIRLFRNQKIASGPTAQKLYYQCPTDLFCVGLVTGYLPGYASPEITLQEGKLPPQP